MDVGEDEGSETSTICAVRDVVDDFRHASLEVCDIHFSLRESSVDSLLRVTLTGSLPTHIDTTAEALESKRGMVIPSHPIHSNSDAAN